MFCKKCGAQIEDNSDFCPKCGCKLNESASKAPDPSVSPKSRLVAALLCFFFGAIGVHRFYCGKTGTGIAMIFTIGGLGVWTFIDLIMILCGSFRDSDGRTVKAWLDE